ncbi:MAG: hypothetical protein JKY37_00985 [Nannocystaceae bacterium]|nr:hypothetical protein [Nannocystaceae bacterium]
MDTATVEVELLRGWVIVGEWCDPFSVPSIHMIMGLLDAEVWVCTSRKRRAVLTASATLWTWSLAAYLFGPCHQPRVPGPAPTSGPGGRLRG